MVCPFGTFFDSYGIFLTIWYKFSHFGMLYLEKSGNPGALTQKHLLSQFFSLLKDTDNQLRLKPNVASAAVGRESEGTSQKYFDRDVFFLNERRNSTNIRKVTKSSKQRFT
jgi:hypothetical protein